MQENTWTDKPTCGDKPAYTVKSIHTGKSICTRKPTFAGKHTSTGKPIYASKHTYAGKLTWTGKPMYGGKYTCTGKSIYTTPPPPQPFYGPFSRTTRVSQCQKRTSGLHGARKIPHFLQAGCSSCRPTNSVKAQKATSAFKGRLTEADTLTIRLGATPSRLSIAHLHHPSHFLQARCPSCHPKNSVKAVKAKLCNVNKI